MSGAKNSSESDGRADCGNILKYICACMYTDQKISHFFGVYLAGYTRAELHTPVLGTAQQWQYSMITLTLLPYAV